MDLGLNNFGNQYSENDLKRLCGLLALKGACFPSEMARDLNLNIDQVNAMLTKAIQKGDIIKIIPDRVYPQNLMKCRIAEMWSLGIEGYEKFAARSWFVLSAHGFAKYIKENLGKGKKANFAYAQEYDYKDAEPEME